MTPLVRKTSTQTKKKWYFNFTYQSYSFKSSRHHSKKDWEATPVEPNYHIMNFKIYKNTENISYV